MSRTIFPNPHLVHALAKFFVVVVVGNDNLLDVANGHRNDQQVDKADDVHRQPL